MFMRRSRRNRLAAPAAAGLILIGWMLYNPGSALAAAQAPSVELIHPERGPPTRSLDLPGNVNAWYEAPIYAQVAGYVQSWTKDYGAPVKQGELLATIATPALDQQFASAEANLAAADARYQLAAVTAKRWQRLSGTEAVAQQDVDVQVAGAEAQAAQVNAARHEVARYQALEAFKRVVAPFDGVVTSRRTDVGTLVTPTGGDAGSSRANSELFTVADIHKLRVFVSVPEDFADALKPGLTATLTLPQFPGRSFVADYATTASAFNPVSRSVITELTVDNRNHAIWPGTYANVHFAVPADPDVLIVPEQALLFRAQGMQVALVDAQSHVHLQDVVIGLNLGQTVQVLSGLKAEDRLINDPSAGLLEGEAVEVRPPASAASTPPPKSVAPHGKKPDGEPQPAPTDAAADADLQ